MAKAKPIKGLNEQAPLAVNAALVLSTRLDEMLAYAPYVTDVNCVYELHQMRISAKRLRYSMEIFQDLYTTYTALGPGFLAALTEVKALQDHLGVLHDADVLTPQLSAHLAHLLQDGFGVDAVGEPIVGVHRVDFDACQGLITLCRQTRTERDARYEAFLRDWQGLHERGVFGTLRALVLEAAQLAVAEAAARAESAPPPNAASAPQAEPPDAQNEIADAEDSSNQTADASRPARRHSGATARRKHAAPPPQRHSRPRSHSAKGASKGRAD